MENVNEYTPSKAEAVYEHGLIIGKFYPPHLGHLHLIRSAQKQVKRLTVLVCTLKAESILGERRYHWMKTLCPTGVDVLHHTAENPSYPHEHPNFWEIWTKSILELIPEAPDVVFTSEDYGVRLASCFGAVHICIDPKRQAFPISGSEIRANPHLHWDFLPEPVRAYYVKRVAILGAESTGKTTLAQKLAESYQTAWVPEYGRSFVAKHNRLPKQEEMLFIAEQQIVTEKKTALLANQVLFCDTTPLTTAIYAKHYFGISDGPLWDLAKNHSYDLVLLAEDDIPWEADGLQRDGLIVRTALQKVFKNTLADLNIPFYVIEGSLQKRLLQAKKWVNMLFFREIH
ncbi:MAG: AAA family ATPase [Rhodothermia bacterium]|nr:AAA family ATPase [Rhodothermia bacterium]